MADGRGTTNRRFSDCSESSTDSWSVIERSSRHSSDSTGSHITERIEMPREVEVDDAEEQEFSDSCDSCSEVHEDPSDIDEELSDEEQMDEDDLSDEDDLEVEDEEDQEDDLSDTHSELSEDDLSDESDEVSGSEEAESSDEDDQISMVDEQETLECSAALQYVSAEKANRTLDILASSSDSPFEILMKKDHTRTSLLFSLMVVSCIGITIGHIIGASWISTLPKAQMDLLHSKPMLSGLQSRHLGRRVDVQPAEVREFLKKYDILNMKLATASRKAYGNCSVVLGNGKRQLNGRRISQVNWLIASNVTLPQCFPVPVPSTPKSIFPSKVHHLPTIPVPGEPSISASLPDFSFSPKPTVIRKVSRPTISREIIPSLERFALFQNKSISRNIIPCVEKIQKSTRVNPPPSVSFRHRQYTKTSNGVCRRPTQPTPIGRSSLRPSPIQKKYQNDSKISKVHQKTARGPVPPPKYSRNSLHKVQRKVKYEVATVRKFQPCPTYRNSSLKQWTALNKNFKRHLPIKSAVGPRSNTSVGPCNRRGENVHRGEYCYVSREYETGLVRWTKRPRETEALVERRTVSSGLQKHSQQCDRRSWNKSKHTPKRLQIAAERRPRIGYHQKLPCVENNKLDKQVRMRRTKTNWRL